MTVLGVDVATDGPILPNDVVATVRNMAVATITPESS